MPRIPNEGLIPRADKLIIRTFPKIAQKLSSEVDSFDRAEMDAFLKMLPGAIERYQAVSVPKTDVHESIEFAIENLIQTFGSRNASVVESMPPDGNSNAPAELEETTGSVSEPELPNGSDTVQESGDNSLSRNELQAAPGNTGESSNQQADGPNPRVRKAPKLSGRARYRRRLQELGEAGNDRGQLSGPEGGKHGS